MNVAAAAAKMYVAKCKLSMFNGTMLCSDGIAKIA